MEERLRASETRLMEAQRLAKVGSWERDTGTDAIHWSDEMSPHLWGAGCSVQGTFEPS